MGDATCTVRYIISTLNIKFRNFEGAETWNKMSNKETKIVALNTILDDQKKKFKDLKTQINKASLVTPSDDGNQNVKNQPKTLLIKEFCINFRGNTITHDVKKWV